MDNKVIDVSVIIPVYNSFLTLERAIISIASQTYLPKEVIIVDDFSSDRKIIKLLIALKEKYREYFDIKLIFLEKNFGAGTARNKGWKEAIGKYIAFLDSDDAWHPQKLEIQYRFMEKIKNIKFSCHHMLVVDEKKYKFFSDSRVEYNDVEIIPINVRKLLYKHYTNGGTPSVMIKNNIEFKFKDDKRYSEDYLLWLEILFNYNGVLINSCLAATFKKIYGAGGLSGNLWKLEKGELETFNILRKKGYINIGIYFTVLIFSLLKYLRRCFICKVSKIYNIKGM
mgnify:CR=1 FL=1|jgi:glycosyltransferase involved in cell wall biosynthesis